MITRFQAAAIDKLFIAGWHLEAGQGRQCRYCGMVMQAAALHSPQGGVYHIGCASASGQERLSRNQKKCNNGRAAQVLSKAV